jgi:hypothetical protein
MKKVIYGIGVLSMMVAGSVAAQDDARSSDTHTLIVTASNTTNNQLLIYNTKGALLKQIPTEGQGGVGGNAGGIAQNHDRLAVVNFGSDTVTVFAKERERATFHTEQLISTISSPVSVAFGRDHLYVLTATHVESHRIDRSGVQVTADGESALLVGDGSAAQVGTLENQLIISEKSNAIETVKLNGRGAIAGSAVLVANIPSNVNAPFGLATRGNDAYVTIAHADEISLVRHDAVLTVTGSGTQHAPCWVTLDGPFLFSANSPSRSVSRYAVYGERIIQDAATVTTFNGNPTDITYGAGLAAVVDADGTNSHVSVFKVDEDGNFSLKGLATINGVATNGVAIVRLDENADD